MNNLTLNKSLENCIGSLSLYYFKVPDTKIGTYHIEYNHISFYLSGKVILDSTSILQTFFLFVQIVLYIKSNGQEKITGSILVIAEL